MKNIRALFIIKKYINFILVVFLVLISFYFLGSYFKNIRQASLIENNSYNITPTQTQIIDLTPTPSKLNNLFDGISLVGSEKENNKKLQINDNLPKKISNQLSRTHYYFSTNINSDIKIIESNSTNEKSLSSYYCENQKDLSFGFTSLDGFTPIIGTLQLEEIGDIYHRQVLTGMSNITTFSNVFFAASANKRNIYIYKNCLDKPNHKGVYPILTASEIIEKLEKGLFHIYYLNSKSTQFLPTPLEERYGPEILSIDSFEIVNLYEKGFIFPVAKICGNAYDGFGSGEKQITNYCALADITDYEKFNIRDLNLQSIEDETSKISFKMSDDGKDIDSKVEQELPMKSDFENLYKEIILPLINKDARPIFQISSAEMMCSDIGMDHGVFQSTFCKNIFPQILRQKGAFGISETDQANIYDGISLLEKFGKNFSNDLDFELIRIKSYTRNGPRTVAYLMDTTKNIGWEITFSFYHKEWIFESASKIFFTEGRSPDTRFYPDENDADFEIPVPKEVSDLQELTYSQLNNQDITGLVSKMVKRYPDCSLNEEEKNEMGFEYVCSDSDKDIYEPSYMLSLAGGEGAYHFKDDLVKVIYDYLKKNDIDFSNQSVKKIFDESNISYEYQYSWGSKGKEGIGISIVFDHGECLISQIILGGFDEMSN